MGIKYRIIEAIARATKQTGSSPWIKATEAQELVKDGEGLILDVREEEEVTFGMAEPAQWIATSEFENGTEKWTTFVSTLPKDKVIVVYCAAGVRSGRVADYLATQGFQCANMGGYDDWLADNLPTRTP